MNRPLRADSQLRDRPVILPGLEKTMPLLLFAQLSTLRYQNQIRETKGQTGTLLTIQCNSTSIV